MTPTYRAERIVLASRQDRYAKATKFLEFVAAEIEAAVKEEIRERLATLEYVKKKEAFAEGFSQARTMAAGCVTDHPSKTAERIRALQPPEGK